MKTDMIALGLSVITLVCDHAVAEFPGFSGSLLMGQLTYARFISNDGCIETIAAIFAADEMYSGDSAYSYGYVDITSHDNCNGIDILRGVGGRSNPASAPFVGKTGKTAILHLDVQVRNYVNYELIPLKIDLSWSASGSVADLALPLPFRSFRNSHVGRGIWQGERGDGNGHDHSWAGDPVAVQRRERPSRLKAGFASSIQASRGSSRVRLAALSTVPGPASAAISDPTTGSPNGLIPSNCKGSANLGHAELFTSIT